MYSSKQIEEAVSTVHLNSRRQAKRALVTNFANGDINYIGDCCFSYSGGINVGAGVEQTISEFITNSSYMITEMQFSVLAKNQSDNSTFIVYMNDVVLYFNETEDTESAGFDAPLKLVIPPFTKIKITAAITGAGGIEHAALVTGKVYAGAEIIQGAI